MLPSEVQLATELMTGDKLQAPGDGAHTGRDRQTLGTLLPASTSREGAARAQGRWSEGRPVSRQCSVAPTWGSDLITL